MNGDGSAEKILALGGRPLLLVLEVRSVELVLARFGSLALRLLGQLFQSLLLHQLLVQSSVCIVELLLSIGRDLLRYLRVLFLGNRSEVVNQLDHLHLLHLHPVHVLNLLLAGFWLCLGRLDRGLDLLLLRNPCLGWRVLIANWGLLRLL